MSFEAFEEQGGTAGKSRWPLVGRTVFGLWLLVADRIAAAEGHAPAAIKRCPTASPGIAATEAGLGDAVGDLGDFEDGINRRLDALQFACALQRRDPVPQI